MTGYFYNTHFACRQLLIRLSYHFCMEYLICMLFFIGVIKLILINLLLFMMNKVL